MAYTLNSIRSSQLPKDSDLYWPLWFLEVDLEMWASYTLHPPEGTTRKEQRTYQRKFCSTYSKRSRFIEANLEHFL